MLPGSFPWQGLPCGRRLRARTVSPAACQLGREMSDRSESPYLEGAGLEEGCGTLISHSWGAGCAQELGDRGA